MKKKIKLTDDFNTKLIIELTAEHGMALKENALISEDEYFRGIISSVGGKNDSFNAIIDVACDEDGYIKRYDFMITTIDIQNDNEFKFKEYYTLQKYAKRFYELYKKECLKE